MHNQGLGSWTSRRARMTPWRTALTVPGGPATEAVRITYAALHTRVTRLAHGLGENHPAFLETMFAAGMLGAVFVPLHLRFSAQQLAWVLEDTTCEILVYGPAGARAVDELRPQGQVREYLRIGPAAPESDRRAGSLEELLAEQPETPIDEPVELSEPCLISYTSGTTGRPKGVVLSHGNLTWNVFNLLSSADYLSEDVLLQAAPLYRLGGLGMVALPGLFKGAQLVVTPEADPQVLLRVIDRYRVTVLFGSPGLFEALLESPLSAQTDLSSLRLCFCGGDAVPESLIRAWLERGVRFQQGYGLTEAAPMALLLDAEEIAARIGAAGRPPFFADVRVVRPDMSDAAAGQSGEIVIRGPNVMVGYWGLSEATDAAITHGGWLHSGDAARVQADGHIYVLGRTADAIELAAGTVYPAEIERELERHPGVAECAAVGYPDGPGTSVAAFVVCRPGSTCREAELVSFWSRLLPAERLPRRVELVDSLPRNVNGKLVHRLLRERLGEATTAVRVGEGESTEAWPRSSSPGFGEVAGRGANALDWKARRKYG
jgi:fatty-acyl-CoA synthase